MDAQNQVGSQAAVVIGANVVDASFADGLSSDWNQRVMGHTNIGKGRRKNQDAASFFNYLNGDEHHLILSVADGLGSSPFSEKAAHYAVSQIPQGIMQGGDLVENFRQVHRKLVEQQFVSVESSLDGQLRQFPTMGTTTLVLADVFENHLLMANVGDSRGYVVRKKKIVYQTRDQSATELLLHEQKIKNELEVRRHPLRNVILNALGSPEIQYRFLEKGEVVMKPSGLPVIDNIELQKGDAVLLASDGFYTNISEEEIIDAVCETPWNDLEEFFSSLIQKVFKRGKTILGEESNADNYTFVVYRHL